MELALGKGVARDEGKRAGFKCSAEDLGELADHSGAEALGSKVVLIKATVRGKRDGGEELLESLEFLSLKRTLGILRLLESEVVFEAAADGFIER